MRTASGSHRKAQIFVRTLLRAWSFGVYYVGYRLLSVHVSCGSLAVSGVPFVMKYGA